jgi:3-phenylpropionate/trans-cinnamate dioxygenase ferredoxin reductase subunit
MSRQYDVVLVGAGLGGLRTAEHLRERGFSGSIALIGGEQRPPYDRPPLTKQVLRGEVDTTEFTDALAALEATLLLGERVEALDANAHEIVLASGLVGYNTAVLAPGGVPRPLPGVATRPGLHQVRTLDDALALRDAVRRAGNVAVVGGGFIGCEVAASLRQLGADVDLVELLPAPLHRVLGPAGASIVATLHTEHGVRLHVGVGVAAVLGEDHVAGLRLTDGTEITTSEVVLGLGVTPDVAWLEGSAVKLENGIMCDGGGRTSAPDVYALGDAACWDYPALGASHRLEHWTTTTDQAAVVAANIVDATADARLNTPPYFWSDQYDVKIQALGHVDAEDEVELLTPGGRSVLLYSRNGKVTAVVGFSAARFVMKLRPLIASGADAAQVRAQLQG